MNHRIALLLLPFALAGCAKINEAGMRLVASNLPAFAVVGNAVLSGTASLYVDRSGTLSLDDTEGSGLKCMGRLRYTATNTGVIHLQCSNGVDAQVNFTAVRETSGYGNGRSAQGPVSLAFGFEAADAPAYLALPPGKRLSEPATGQEQNPAAK